MLEVYESQDIVIQGVTLLNSSFWNVHLVYSERILVKGIQIFAPLDVGGNDGIDPDSSRDVIIEDSFISVGDDCVAVKSGWDCFGIRANRPSENIFIRNMTCIGGGGIAIGSEISGGVRNVSILDSTLSQLGLPAIFIKFTKYRGGFVDNVLVKNITVKNDAIRGNYNNYGMMTIVGNYGYRWHDDKNPACGSDPHVVLPDIHSITFQGISGYAGPHTPAGVIEGLEGKPIRNVQLTDISLVAGPWNCSGFTNLTATNVTPPCCSNDLQIRVVLI